jgi:hypothetical protein
LDTGADTTVYPVKLENESGELRPQLTGTPYTFFHKFNPFVGRFMTNKQWFTGKSYFLKVLGELGF